MPSSQSDAATRLRTIVGKLTGANNLGSASNEGAFAKIEEELASISTQDIFDHYYDATEGWLERVEASLQIIALRIDEPLIHPLVRELLETPDLKNAHVLINAIRDKRVLALAADLNPFLRVKHEPPTRRQTAFRAAATLAHPSNYTALTQATLSAETAAEAALAGGALRLFPKHVVVYDFLVKWFNKLQHRDMLEACARRANGTIDDSGWYDVIFENDQKLEIASTLARWGNRPALEHLITQSHDKGFSYNSGGFCCSGTGVGERAAIAIMDAFGWYHLRPLRHGLLTTAVHQLLREHGYLTAGEGA